MKKSTLPAIFFMALFTMILAGTIFAQGPFTPGNLVIYRVGDGVATLANTGNPVFLDEYTPAGVLVQSVPMPTTVSGANYQLVASGTATSEGMITRSTNGEYLVLTGYGANIPYASSLVSTLGTVVPRVVGLISADGTINTTTALSDFASGNNPRSAASTDGTDLWVCGGNGGPRYAVAGGTTSTQISTTLTNLRVLNITDGQLYVSTSSGSAVRIGTIGTGLPTAAGQTITNLPGFPTSGSPYQYFFADLDATEPGVDVVYVADDGSTVGLQKFSKVSGSWIANGNVAISSLRGLTGTVSGSTVTLYGAANQSANNLLVSFTDASGYNAALSGTFTTLATVADTKKAFRGIAFAPAASTITAPTVQTHTFNFSGISQTQITAGWSNGNGGARVVKINTTNTFTPPVDNTTYTGNTVYSGSGEQVVYAGSGSSVTVTGLSAGVTYHFQAWEYNTNGTVTLYCFTSGAGNPAYQATLATATAPFISSPTATGITQSSAILGGNITGDGGSPILERGTIWSITSPVTLADNKLAEGGTASGIFSHSRTGMPTNTTIYYAAYATNAIGTTLTTEASFTTLLGEPTNHAADFAATSANYYSVTNTWLDNDGTQPAGGFLILANKTGIFTDPVDGVPVTNDNSLNDGSGAMNIAHGQQTYTWTGLTGSTQFYFSIYPYTNSGTNIDYKTSPAAPTANATTQVFPVPVAAWTFDADVCPAKPNTPLSLPASFGDQTGAAMLYADGTNGSSLFNCTTLVDTELDAFGGSLTNDPRETGANSGNAYCPAGGFELGANGKSMIFKYSMTALQDPVLTFATRGTSTGFNTQQWAWSIDGTSFTDFGTNTAVNTSTWTLRTLDMSAIDALDGAPTVYLRVTFTGASSATGNNRLDNIVIRASAASTIPPTAITMAATSVMETTATINGTVNANNQLSTVTFEYGETDSYGYTVDAVPSSVGGNETTTVSAAITGLNINTTYHYRVKGVNASGTSYGQDITFITACPIPGDAGVISGPAEVCANGGTYQYTVDNIQYATGYTWSVPAGATIISGDNTNSILVEFAPGASTGDFSVFGINDCGDGNASDPYSVTVTQPLTVSVSLTASANPVNAGTEVTFTATPVNGGSTPTYTFKINNMYQTPQSSPEYTYIPSDGDQVLCIMASSLTCVTGTPATSNTVVMTVNSSVPENLSVSGVVAAGSPVCYNATNTITVAGTPLTYELQTGANATFIAGQKILYLPGTTIQSGAYMLGYISTGSYCSPLAKESETGSVSSMTALTGQSFRIYPNPTRGEFTVDPMETGNSFSVNVYNPMGKLILSNNSETTGKRMLSIAGQQPGIYFVRITSGNNTQTIKIVMTR